MKPHSRARPFQETDRAKHSKHSKHRMNILLIGSVSHAKIRTLLAAPNAIVARHPKRAMRPWFKIRDHRATRHRQSIVQILAVTQNTPNTTKILLGTSRLHRHMVHSKVAMVHSKVAMVHSKVVTANSNSRVAMVNHKVATVNHKVATVNSNSRVVATPMIGFAAAVGTTTLPEGRNAISANNLVTRIQSWLNHLHSKVVMVNSKAVMVNKVAVNKVATPMIGCATAVGTTTLPEGQNAISANNLEDRIQSWLNHLHSKVVMVNSKVVTVNSKAVMVNSKAVTVNSKAVTVNSKAVMVNSKVATVTKVTVEECKHSTPMIGFAAAVGTTTLPEGRNAISANNLVTRIQTQFEPHQEQAQTRLSIRMIGAVVHVETTTLREGRNAIGASSRKMRSMLGRLQIHKMQRQQHQLQS